MSSFVPDTQPAPWSVLIIRGTTWPATTIEMVRDGVTVIPVSASFTITDPDGTVQVTLAATIDGAGVMTIGPISAVTTAAYMWSYGNTALVVTETGSVKTLLLAGNATCVDRSD